MPLVVEFLGPAGSGKSTLAESVIEGLHDEGRRCPRRSTTAQWQRAFGFQFRPKELGVKRRWAEVWPLSYAGWLMAYPEIAIRAYAYGLSVRPERRRALRLSKAPMVWMRLMKQMICGSPYDLIVLEEGVFLFIHIPALVGVEHSPQRLEGLVRAVWKRWPHPVVHLEIPPEQVLRRLVSRETGWRYGEEAAEVQLAKLRRSTQIIGQIASCLESVSPGSVLRIDGQAPVEENVARVMERIRSWDGRRDF